MGTKKSQHGSVLLESVVAMVMVATGAVGMLKLQATLMNNAAEAKVRSEATTLAQAKIDDLRDTMLSSEHFAMVGTTCNAGSRMISSSDAPSASSSATYTRTWTVTPDCAQTKKHHIQVTVAWGTGSDQSVALNSIIAWNDPAKAVTTAGSAGAGSGAFGTPSSAKLINNAPLTDWPSGSPDLRNDGTATYYDTTNHVYSLYVKVGAKYQKVMESKVELISLSGLIAIEDVSGFSVDMTKVNVEGSEAVYCTPPLRFGNENQPSTYGVSDGTISQSSDKAAAYVCYVPTGWAGTLSLYEKSANCGYQLYKNNKNGSCGFTEALACPELVDGSVNLSGQRTIKALVLDSAGAIIGQSGVLPGHITMLMPNGEGLMRTQRLDFAIYKPGTGSTPQRCPAIFPTPGSGLSGSVNGVNYSVKLRAGAGTNSSVTYGVPSMRYPHYVIEAYAGTGGFATVSGSLAGTCTPNAIGSGSFTGKNYGCTTSGANYTCNVGIGWTGTIGATALTTAVPAEGATLDVTCP